MKNYCTKLNHKIISYNTAACYKKSRAQLPTCPGQYRACFPPRYPSRVRTCRPGPRSPRPPYTRWRVWSVAALSGTVGAIAGYRCHCPSWPARRKPHLSCWLKQRYITPCEIMQCYQINLAGSSVLIYSLSKKWQKLHTFPIWQLKKRLLHISNSASLDVYLLMLIMHWVRW